MPKEIAEKLSATGFNVKANEVSIAKYRMKAMRRGKKAAKGGSSGCHRPYRRCPRSRRHDLHDSVEAAKKLVKELGGVDKAKRAIESLGRLVD